MILLQIKCAQDEIAKNSSSGMIWAHQLKIQPPKIIQAFFPPIPIQPRGSHTAIRERPLETYH
jgi:hypothetical protein